MNNCADPNSHNTVRTMDGKRQCNCTRCINERVNLQSMRAKAQRRMMTGKRPNSLIAWLSSEEWIQPWSSLNRGSARTRLGVYDEFYSGDITSGVIYAR